MATVITVRDMLYHYTYARGAYERVLCECDHHPPQVARNAVALLLWLDQGTNLVISALSNMDTTALDLLITEASLIINCLQMKYHPGPPTPHITSLCHDNGLDQPGFFPLNQGLIARGVAGLLDGVCMLIFDDHLYHLLRRYQTGLVGLLPELETPYDSFVVTVPPEDCRSMFVTFSIDQAVERHDIFNYFREIWGDCIVRVLMEKTTGGAQPRYGRVIFKSRAFVSLLLNGEERAQIFMCGRVVWLREYIPRNRSNN